MEHSLNLPVTCNRDAGCPLIAEVVDGRLMRIRDNPRL